MPKAKNKPENIILSRPPIVTIMGHVDHGKTTLLDAIRQTHVAEKEYGGITQSIGAYQVEIDTKDGKKKITFIDTPGHEAFEKMRSRGAAVTDIAVIVIDGIDGVMPQTLESLHHCQKAEVPFLIAVNKMDLPEASVQRVQKQLAKENILTEGFGGEIVVVPVSAKTKMGLDNLLEMILLLSEMKGIASDEKGELDAVIIESKMDKHTGPLASVIVKSGTLKTGEEIQAEDIKGKVRALINDQGKPLDSAGPGTPVVIQGFQKVPAVGTKVTTEITEIKNNHQAEIKEIEMKLPEEKPSKLNVILKTDTAGSLEAIERSLSEETVEIIDKGVGEITESDILMAKSNKAIVIGFNAKVSNSVKKLAENEKVLVNNYPIIYQLLDDVNDAAGFVNTPKETEKILGKAKIIAQFPSDKYTIAGCKISEGRLAQNDSVKIFRGEEEVFISKIATMKHGKESIQKADKNMECGVIFDPSLDFSLGDDIIAYRKIG